MAVFAIISDIFDLCILKFVFKRSILLQRRILEARFWAPTPIFTLHVPKRSTRISNVRPEIRTFGQKFERSTGNSNLRPETRTFGPIWGTLENLERSTENSNVRPEIRTFDRKFERSTGNSNVRPEIQTFDRKFEEALPPSTSRVY